MLECFEDWYRADLATRRGSLDDLLARIRDRDRIVCAWVEVDPRPATGTGPLDAIPFGVKDVIETADMATEYGSPLYRGRRGVADAEIVSQLRRRGGILLGKTHSAAFACRTPPVTRNPRNPAHTPGGSSSGSAAAVAAGMVPFAIGTQTHGSVLRPAAYCGVTGFKPSFGRLPTAGVLPVAPSLDTLGLFTHSPRDMALLWQAMGEAGQGEAAIVLGVPEPAAAVDENMTAAYADALAVLRRSGFAVRPVAVGRWLADLPAENRIVEFYEGARGHEARYREFGDRLNDVAEMVREGLTIPAPRYDAARAFIAEARDALDEAFAVTPVIVTPAATGAAPWGLASTGDARMNSPWTSLATPAVTVPLPRPADSLPLGLQLTAARGADDALLETAQSVAAALERSRPVV